jgi:hypothetical protein
MASEIAPFRIEVAAFEQPALFVEEVRSFFRLVR